MMNGTFSLYGYMIFMYDNRINLIKRLVQNEMHKNLIVTDIGEEGKPDYVVGGINLCAKSIAGMATTILSIVMNPEYKVENNEWTRAAGECLCPVCQHEYSRHPSMEGYEWLTILCNGTLVKL